MFNTLFRNLDSEKCFILQILVVKEQFVAVHIVTRLRAAQPKVRGSIPGSGNVSLPQSVKPGCGVHPVYSTSTRSSSLGINP